MFIEPYMERCRHIEVQIVGDAHGNVIHLGERECSIQRRHQKVIEESPSAGISPEIRARLCEGAIALARHVGYQNAGTVEFLVADDATVSFLEVNTRLQVEHPVTEAITGLDLVELQLLVAAGDPLPISQDAVAMSGHAIEARVVAEDPAAGWLPSTGKSHRVRDRCRCPGRHRASVPEPRSHRTTTLWWPRSSPTLRPVTVRCGGWPEPLQAAQVTGVQTNIDTLVAILGEAEFVAARTLTTYLDDHPAVFTPAGPEGEDRLALLLGAVFAAEQHDRAADRVTGFAPSGWRNLRTRGQRLIWLLGDDEHPVEYVMESPGDARVRIGPWPQPLEDGSLPPDERRVAVVRLLDRSPGRQVIEVDGRRQVVETELDGDTIHTRSPAGSLTWTLAPAFVVHDAVEAGSGPVCPLPGTVITVHVEPGQTVADGDFLMVIESHEDGAHDHCRRERHRHRRPVRRRRSGRRWRSAR